MVCDHQIFKAAEHKISRPSVSGACKWLPSIFSCPEITLKAPRRLQTTPVAGFQKGSEGLPPQTVAETQEELVRASAGGRSLLQVWRPHTCHEPSAEIAPDTQHAADKADKSGEMRGEMWGWQRLAGKWEGQEAGAQWVTDSRLMGRGGGNGVWSGSPRETVKETICLSAQGRLSLSLACSYSVCARVCVAFNWFRLIGTQVKWDNWCLSP